MVTPQAATKEFKPPPLPGVSYIPDRIEVAEQPDLVHKIEGEFLDFLTSLIDLLKLLHTLKSKHLRSMTPIPANVLRELLKGKGPLFRQFDRQAGGHIPGISASADNLFRKGMSTTGTARGMKSAMKKDVGLKKRPLEADLVEIIGKKTKPAWHIVALEKPPDPLYQPNKVEKEAEEDEAEGPPHSPSYVLEKRGLPLSRTHSEEIIASIKYLAKTSVRPSHRMFQEQMDMLAASDAGFKTVAEYKDYLETLKPHWFKDLVKSAVSIGIVASAEVVDAFEELGKFYDMDSESVPLAKAKTCYLVMSLPIWDITRTPIQMAVDFILHNILEVPASQPYLQEWLTLRKLPYVAFPPIDSESLDAQPRMDKTGPVIESQPEKHSKLALGTASGQ